MKNQYKVPAKTWRQWSKKQRKMFNGVYEDITNVGVDLFVHPITIQRKLSDEEFRTIAWNAAWTAAMILKNMFTGEIAILYKGRVIAVEPVVNRG